MMPTSETLSISLPAEMTRIIRAKVAGGRYASDSDVVREAVRGWIERERNLATLDAAIDRGIGDAEAGRGLTTAEARLILLDGTRTADTPPRP